MDIMTSVHGGITFHNNEWNPTVALEPPTPPPSYTWIRHMN